MSLTTEWLKASLIRAIKTVAQTMSAFLTTSALISEMDWSMIISTSLMAGIASILTSLAGLPEVESVVEEVEYE